MTVRAAVALVACLTLTGAASAQLLPEWHGTWSGECAYGAAGQPGRTLGMTLEVAPADGEGLVWRTTYSQQGQQPQTRDYRLVPTETPDHFLIDERNGIRLDTYRFGHVLMEHFYIGSNGALLFVRWERRGDAVHVEMPSFASRPGRTSTGPGGVKVTSFSLTNLQRCRLDRQ